MISTLVKGQTILNNSSLEPEIDDLIVMLNSMGARIYRDPKLSQTIIIDGVDSLRGTTHQVIADRNETVTFACAALLTKGSINILRTDPKIITTFLETLSTMGAKIVSGKDEVTVSWDKPLKSINIETGPEPFFMTDWQTVFSVLLTQAVGVSSIIERVYPSRFQHITNLEKMGLKVKYFNPIVTNPKSYYEFNPQNDSPQYFHGVKIYGPVKLKPAKFVINDLRAGASTTLAALTATGISIVDNVEYIERGYEKLADRLKSLGAQIEYIKT